MTDVAENTGLKREAFSFTGKAGEYFGIWIVNLLLTIVTAGIYSAWAKVRRQRYFYANTWLDGHNFEYHASGKQILIGRIIVFGFLMVYTLVQLVLPIVSLIMFVILLFVLPWLINKAISFTARVSTYRNVQFGFEGSYGKAFMIYVLLPLIIPVITGIIIILHYQSSGAISFEVYSAVHNIFFVTVLTIAMIAQLFFYPYLAKMAAEYIGNRLSYGDAPFSTLANTGDIYKNYGMLFVLYFFMFLFMIFLSLVISLIFGITAENVSSEPSALMVIIFLFLLVSVYLLMYVPFLFYKAGIRNIAYNGTKLAGKHQMVSNLSRRSYSFIQVTNFLAVICTFGLMRPWAAIRLRNFMVDHTAIDVDGSLDDIVSANEPKGNVAAAEYFDIDGIDFGF